MKKYAQLGFIVLLLALMVTLPVAAAQTSIVTSVNVLTGTGTPPVILAKWETDATSSLEDGDVTHQTPGSQFNPPGTFQGTKTIYYYAIVTDAQGPDVIDEVFAEVWHPTGPGVGEYKYQIRFKKMDKWEGIEALKKVFDPTKSLDLNLITDICDAQCGASVRAPTPECTDLPLALYKDQARVWIGEAEINYHQMDGNYFVDVYAEKPGDIRSASLWNTFYYNPLTAVEYDFTNVDYGDVSQNVNKWVMGNREFADQGDGMPTARNIGNTRANFIINQDHMGFGYEYGMVPNVMFDARLGHNSADEKYAPNTNFELADTLDRCNSDELDFSIHVIKKPNTPLYPGTMKLSVFNPDTTLPSMSYCAFMDMED